MSIEGVAGAGAVAVAAVSVSKPEQAEQPDKINETKEPPKLEQQKDTKNTDAVIVQLSAQNVKST